MRSSESWSMCANVFTQTDMLASNFPFLQCLNFWNQAFADYKNEFEYSPPLGFSGHILDNYYLLLKFLWPHLGYRFFPCFVFVFLGTILHSLKLIPVVHSHIFLSIWLSVIFVSCGNFGKLHFKKIVCFKYQFISLNEGTQNAIWLS